VLLIVVDDLRPQALGCYNSGGKGADARPPTPHMDRLCAASTSASASPGSSVVFWDAHAASPSAAASAASLLLGVHLPVHNLLDDGFGAPE
jgi:arylsulfatase A-like enzyme